MTTEGGGLLLGATEARIGLMSRLASCFRDYRNPSAVEHTVRDLVSQRVYGLALGYEDLNDHNELRLDSLLALLVGKSDITGADRRRARDKGRPLASASSLNRLELSRPEEASSDPYKRIPADGAALDRVLVELFLEAHDEAPCEIVLDLDATDDPLHGEQEGRFFHGYYRCYCYMPLYAFCGEHLLLARLRKSDQDASAGTIRELAPIVARIREAWPEVRIVLRGDSGFCRERIMAWCESEGIDYVFGVARNRCLERWLRPALAKSRRRSVATGKKSRRFRECRYRTRSTWSRKRRVVGKAEWLEKGGNPHDASIGRLQPPRHADRPPIASHQHPSAILSPQTSPRCSTDEICGLALMESRGDPTTGLSPANQ